MKWEEVKTPTRGELWSHVKSYVEDPVQRAMWKVSGGSLKWKELCVLHVPPLPLTPETGSKTRKYRSTPQSSVWRGWETAPQPPTQRARGRQRGVAVAGRYCRWNCSSKCAWTCCLSGFWFLNDGWENLFLFGSFLNTSFNWKHYA